MLREGEAASCQDEAGEAFSQREGTSLKGGHQDSVQQLLADTSFAWHGFDRKVLIIVAAVAEKEVHLPCLL